MGLLGEINHGRKYSLMLAVTTIMLCLNCVTVRSQETDSFATNSPENISPVVENTPTIQPWRRVSLVHSLEHYQSVADSLLFSPDSKILLSGGVNSSSV